MATRGFDRFMLSQSVCQSPTTRRLSDGEFRSFIAALCLAARAPVRGCLLLAEDEPLSAEEVAHEAGVEAKVAAEALRKLTALGVLVDDHTQGCLRFAKWGDFNPAPKSSDTREAWRERKRRQRAREQAERVTQAKPRPESRLASAPPSGDVPPALPAPPSTRRKRDRERYEAEVEAFAQANLPGVDPGRVLHEASWLRRRGQEPTPAALRERLGRAA